MKLEIDIIVIHSVWNRTELYIYIYIKDDVSICKIGGAKF